MTEERRRSGNPAVGITDAIAGVVYPPPGVLQRYLDNGVLRDDTLAEALMRSMTQHADRVALIGVGVSMSYRELDEESDRFAAALLDLGLKPLDRVIFQLVNSVELVVAILACWKANLIPVCTLAAHREKEIAFLAELSEAKAHIVGIEAKFDFPAFALDMQTKVPSLEHIIIARDGTQADTSAYRNLSAAQNPQAARDRVRTLCRDPYQVCVFQLSGGTTSVPKIIPRFNNEYLYNMEAMAAWEGYSQDDVIFMPLQYIHNAAMVGFLFPALLSGAQFVVTTDLKPATVMGVLNKCRPTIFGVAGNVLSQMQKVGIRDLVDLSRVRAVFSTSVARQTEQVLGVTGVHLFGMTEGVTIFGRPGDPEEARFTTVGQPISEWDEVRILAPDSERVLPDGEVGEMVARGPYTFHGYYKSKERNSEVFTADGFYRSGDLMSVRLINGERYYAFEGRLKDVISRGGEKINCEEVEFALRNHPAVTDVAIVAMPDPDYDERACAFVIPANREAALDVETLADFLIHEGFAKFKCPERVEIVYEFPQTAAGKLDKPGLRRIIAGKLAEEVRRAAK